MSRAPIESGFMPRRQPCFYLMAALVVGILADRWLGPPPWVVGALVVAAAIFSISFALKKYAIGVTATALMAIAAIGASLSSVERTRLADSRLMRLYDTGTITATDPVELTGVLTIPPEPAPEGRYLDVEAESVLAHTKITPATGRVRLFVPLIDSEAETVFDSLGLEHGSRVRVLVRLERARTFSNPGSPDFNDFLERQGFDLKGTVKSPLLIERIGEAHVNPLLAGLHDLRAKAMAGIDHSFKRPVAGTLKAMLVGNRHFLDREIARKLREGGTFHVLAISGLHVGIIAWVLLAGWRRRGRRAVVATLVSLTLLWAYAVMVGLAPPVTRATAMITVGLIGPLLFRRAASLNSVALAAFVMLALKPALVADPSFQLSFIAVAGVVVLALPIADKLRGIGEWRPTANTPHPPRCSRAVRFFGEALFWDDRRFRDEMRNAPVRYQLQKTAAARVLGRLRIQGFMRAVVLLVITSASIQLFTLPLMAAYFNRMTPAGVLLNIVAGLLTAVLMLAGLAAVALNAATPWLAAQLERLVNAAHHVLANAIVPFASMPGATFRVAHYEGWQTIIYAVYFAPLVLLVLLIDRWRPVGEEGDAGTRRHGDAGRGRDDAGTGRRGRDDTETRGREDAARGSSDRAMTRGRSALAASGRGSFAASPRPRVAASLACAAAVLASIVAVARVLPASHSSGKLTVHFLDVGQGDSALIVFPGGTTMLVDGGGELRFHGAGETHGNDAEHDDPGENEVGVRDSSFSVGEAVVSRFLWSLGLTRVDYVVATHADADHISGLSDVVRNFRVGEALVGHVPARRSDLEFDAFVNAVSERVIPLATIAAGDRFEIEGVQVEVLWPRRDSPPPVTSGNNDSVVLRLHYGSASLLLTGDIEAGAEEVLVQSGVELHADLLKVPHHGSKTSSSEAFIDAVTPRCAVISVGERSRFGHPNSEVVDRYVTRGIRALQTGRDGMITVETDGRSVEVNTYRNPRE